MARQERCACGAKIGQLHRELFCDMEECPFCGGQLMSCDCCYDELGVDPHPDEGSTVFIELTPKQNEEWVRRIKAKGRIRYGKEAYFSRNPFATRHLQQLTQELLDPYVGGQMVIQRSRIPSLMCGEVASLRLRLGVRKQYLDVRFAWLASHAHFHPTMYRCWKRGWWMERRRILRIPLPAWNIRLEADRTLVFETQNVLEGEVVALIPQGRQELDPSIIQHGKPK